MFDYDTDILMKCSDGVYRKRSLGDHNNYLEYSEVDEQDRDSLKGSVLNSAVNEIYFIQGKQRGD